jgi:hypothetical protein
MVDPKTIEDLEELPRSIDTVEDEIMLEVRKIISERGYILKELTGIIAEFLTYTRLRIYVAPDRNIRSRYHVFDPGAEPEFLFKPEADRRAYVDSTMGRVPHPPIICMEGHYGVFDGPEIQFGKRAGAPMRMAYKIVMHTEFRPSSTQQIYESTVWPENECDDEIYLMHSASSRINGGVGVYFKSPDDVLMARVTVLWVKEEDQKIYAFGFMLHSSWQF